MSGKYEKYIVRQPKILDSLENHGAGKYQILMDDELIPDSELVIIGGITKRIYQDNHVTKHKHSVNETFVFLSKKGEAEIEVEIGEETYNVLPPVSVYIPKGIPHAFRYKRIDSPLTVVAIVQGGTYKTYDV